MKAMILAAGLGTRLRPWTLSHPKALVPVGGVPMLKRVIDRLVAEGFDYIVINVHHFSEQIKEFVASHDFGNVRIIISDETDRLLDTGGGLLYATPLLCADDAPYLVHNVDILSNAPLAELLQRHVENGNDVTLLTSGRTSLRHLVFSPDGRLAGWHNLSTGEMRPSGFMPSPDMHESAFSGIYVISPSVHTCMREYGTGKGDAKFPIMDFFLSNTGKKRIGEVRLDSLDLIDIGKPETLSQADSLFQGK